MRITQSQRIFNVISGLWVGSFFAVGFLVAPILFSSLGDRQIAGLVAANLFKITAYIGVCLSAILMVAANFYVRTGLDSYRMIRWILLGMLICSIGAAFILIPWMNILRDQALYLGVSVTETNNADFFKRLHGISSALFLLQSTLGIVLLWRTTKTINTNI
ncbi:DUF4149 domain-containing protein [Polynucleobacter asymbioticus]|uniref:TMEM205-like domain-containing protein n=1 Tax=Polynucleobacter asymbioticus TaxID=576611 RepID=A0AAC9IST5_9BURK|nr:DUF4149 domain-containing protein [Polynucleobacter asymbioticus]APB98888.1 hypothetical protein A4F89_05885 [Polynucleobacter asymbioticus]APC01190.1 hypothetical protein AOC25_05985 [Polynucleobacter asymbioticus]